MAQVGPRRGRPAGSQGPQLLAAARGVFLDRGLAAATMDEVAARARISKASLYREHRSKDDLFAAVVQDWAARGRGSMRPALEELLATTDVRAGLLRLARTMQAAVLAPDVVRMRRLVAGQADRLPAVAACYLADSWDANIAALGEAVAALTARGSLETSEPRLAAEQLTWLVVGGPLNQHTLTGQHRTLSNAELDGVAEAAVDTFLARYAATP